MNKVKINFTLNGRKYSKEVAGDMLLTDFLREEMKLTGTKVSCGKGECGACTVIIDEEPVNACLVFAAQIDGRNITTIEGLADEGKLNPLQQAFIDEGAVQCGYCIPGMIMSAHAFLKKNPTKDESKIQEAISGNLCRCTGYVKIVKAVQKASESYQKKG